ncbi:hypothetical protein KW790_02420 [Candidatus Parcubacteria bacterium]|nr:hypothetical protein [Candidatus Parcubacteria bacterium]
MSSFVKNNLERIKHHNGALILGVVAAVLLALPTFLSIRDLGVLYKGVPFMYQDYESTYMARIHEILDGHRTLGSPMIYEYKNTPTPLAPTGEYIYALPALLGIPLPLVDELSKFILPFILFLLIYSLTYLLLRGRVERPKLYASLAAVLSVLGYDLLQFKSVLEILAHGPQSLYLSLWTRLVNPITGALYLFAFLICAWLVYIGRKRIFILAGILLGLMTGYIFSLTLGLVVSVLLLILCLMERRRLEAKNFLGTLLISGLIIFYQVYPFLFSHLILTGSALKNGLILTHHLLLNKFLIVSSLILLGLLWWRRKENYSMGFTERFVLVLMLASLIVTNEQVVTGRNIWPQHFVQYIIPLCFIVLSVCLAFINNINKFKILFVSIAVFCIGLAFVFNIRVLTSYSYVLNDLRSRQRYEGLFNYLNSYAREDCVVLAEEETESLAAYIPAFTSCNTYYTTYVFVGIPQDRIKHNLFIHLRVDGIKPSGIDQYLSSHPLEVQANFFQDWKEIFRHTNNSWLASISDREAIDEHFNNLNKELAQEYKEFYKADLYTELKKYKIDYIVVDKDVDPNLLSKLSFANLVYSNEGINLYEVK